MVFNVIFNNISACRHGGGYWSVTDKLYLIMMYTLPWAGFKLKTLVGIHTDCRGSCKWYDLEWKKWRNPIANLGILTYKYQGHM